MIIAKTPLRISFFGGGTDFPTYYKRFGGRVVGTAIDKFTYALVTKRYDDLIYVGYSKQEIVNTVGEIRHDLVREAAKLTGMTKGFEVKTFADIPSEGSGLGSSSSITISLLNAFWTYQGIQVPCETLAEQACKIEVDILEKPIGKQDQYLCALGGINKIIFNKDDSVEISKDVEIPYNNKELFEKSLFLFYTGITRKADPILQSQHDEIEAHLEDYHKLYDLAENIETFYGEDSFILKLNKTWEIKKKLSPLISNSEIDHMMQTIRACGIPAAKLLGAGGGGYILIYCPPQYDKGLYFMREEIIPKYKQLPFKFEPFGSRIIFNYRRD